MTSYFESWASENRAALIGDAGLALAAYLEWGEECAEHFLGDFAFAIWDPRHHRLFCARDHMGMRQLIYHHSPGRFFAFATEPRAVLVLPQVGYRINEERIADYLVEELEGVDKTSTFFEAVYRLPPAHTLTITDEGVRQRQYWKVDTEHELRLGSADAYAEAFLEVFTKAVHCRLRTVGPVGSMLSGGVDSGSIVAVARKLLAAENRGPLLTFSAISPDGDEPETRAILAALTMDGLDPTTVSYGQLDDLLPDLEQLARDEDEPFDRSMTLVRAVYLSARRRGLKMLLDGAGGDSVLTEGRLLARLLRAGRWRAAYREAAGQNRFWNGALPPHRELLRSARPAFVPELVLRPLRRWRQRARIERTLRSSPIDTRFGQRIAVVERLRMLDGHSAPGPLSDARLERARAVSHPYLAVGRERYDRVAGVIGIEPRDPFLDLRVLSLSRASLTISCSPPAGRRRFSAAQRRPATRCGAVASRQGASWLGVHGRADRAEAGRRASESRGRNGLPEPVRRRGGGAASAPWFRRCTECARRVSCGGIGPLAETPRMPARRDPRRRRRGVVSSTREQRVAPAPGARYAYRAPRLTAYGPLNTLTRGGSGHIERGRLHPRQHDGLQPGPDKAAT